MREVTKFKSAKQSRDEQWVTDTRKSLGVELSTLHDTISRLQKAYVEQRRQSYPKYCLPARDMYTTWSKSALQCLAVKAEPENWVLAQFVAIANPAVESLSGSLALENYTNLEASFNRKEIHDELFRNVHVWMSWRNNSGMTPREILEDPRTMLSYPFRYCMAVFLQYDDLANNLRVPAMRFLSSKIYRQTYKAIFPDLMATLTNQMEGSK